MNKIEHFLLPENTNELYKNEAISSIYLTKEVAEKINDLVDAYNEVAACNLEKHQELEGYIRKGVIFMKDNLVNSLHDLFKLLQDSGELDNIITEALFEGFNRLKYRTDSYVSVMEFGAAGDGIQNDTEAIQQAIDSGSKVIMLPPGIYKVNGLVIPSDVTIEGVKGQTMIYHAENSQTDLFTSKDFASYANGKDHETEEGCVKNVVISNLILKGSNVAEKNGVSLYGYNITLHDLEVRSFEGKGIHLEAPGLIHSTPDQNLQNDIYNITVSDCKGGNLYYDGQSDSVFNNVLCYYTEGILAAKNMILGLKSHGCKFNGVHLWGECDTHLTVNSVGCTFANLHVEGALTQIEVNNRFTIMQCEIYDPIHTQGGSTGFKFGKESGNFFGQISCRNIETVFDYQGNSPYGHTITGHVSQNIDGVLFNGYPTAPFINLSWYANGEYKWETILPWATLKENWSGFNTKTPPTFDVNGERVFATVNNGVPSSYLVFENGNTSRGSKIRMGGTEPDADLQLEAKGSGKIRFGSFTEGTSDIEGYIEIKDSTGTIRKLAVIS